MSRDLRDAKPGEVYRDKDGDVWGIMRDGRVALLILADGSLADVAPRAQRHALSFGPFTRLVPEEREEW